MVHIKNKQKQNLKESGTLELAKMLRSWLKRQSEECSLTAFSAWTLDLIWSKRRSVCVCVCVRERERKKERERERDQVRDTHHLETWHSFWVSFSLYPSLFFLLAHLFNLSLHLLSPSPHCPRRSPPFMSMISTLTYLLMAPKSLLNIYSSPELQICIPVALWVSSSSVP